MESNTVITGAVSQYIFSPMWENQQLLPELDSLLRLCFLIILHAAWHVVAQLESTLKMRPCKFGLSKIVKNDLTNTRVFVCPKRL